MAFGVSLSLKSNLGVSPVNSLPNEISLVANSFGINLSWAMLLSSSFPAMFWCRF
ncbi:MAG TPA: hypothetical protein IAC40_06580 [Candidatus Faecivivens stercorigallinarum]|nr:hypothetical protein [Candidatus Faecivivens stercorigallinarum]